MIVAKLMQTLTLALVREVKPTKYLTHVPRRNNAKLLGR